MSTPDAHRSYQTISVSALWAIIAVLIAIALVIGWGTTSSFVQFMYLLVTLMLAIQLCQRSIENQKSR